MKIVILVDWKVTSNTKFWLQTELEKLGHATELRGIPNYNIKDDSTRLGKIRLWFKYLKLAKTGIKRSGKSGIIITDNFVVGAIAAFICKISRKRRKIISLNMIAHEKGFLNSVLRKGVYNAAFKYKSFWFSVNDEELIAEYSKRFNFPTKNIFVLHDPFYSSDEQLDYEDSGNFIFTGGDAFRDWEGFIQCAKDLPGIHFIGVARRKYFPADIVLPANLKMYFDIPQEEFYDLLKKSMIVFLPLKSLAPCGLIVMVKAALLSKPVIITETPSTRNYIKNDLSGKLVKMNDVMDMQSSILSLYHSVELRKKYTQNLKSYVIDNFSTEKNAKIINEVIAV